MLHWIQNVDWTILLFIQTQIKCGFLDFIMPKITVLGDYGAVWLLIAFIMLFTKKYRKCSVMIITGIALGFVFGNIFLKPLVGRLRPCFIDTAVQMIVPLERDYSFPSGHTLASFIAATILILNNKKFSFVALPLAVIIGFSRLYLFLHFPTDVLAGAFFGVAIGVTVSIFVTKVFEIINLRHKKAVKT